MYRCHILAALYVIQQLEKTHVKKCMGSTRDLPLLIKFGPVCIKQGEGRKGRVRKGRGRR
jgi:hypothetical protein